jgi:hypothetical protein
MRYLGAVIQKLADSTKREGNSNLQAIYLSAKFDHLHDLLEREVFLRSLKHVFNHTLKDRCGDSDLYLAASIAHLLNCVLAPTSFIN